MAEDLRTRYHRENLSFLRDFIPDETVGIRFNPMRIPELTGTRTTVPR